MHYQVFQSFVAEFSMVCYDEQNMPLVSHNPRITHARFGVEKPLVEKNNAALKFEINLIN